MDNFIDYTLQDLENLVAAAPYSQYHQMLLALKKNELQKGSIYQPYLGNLPELKAKIVERAEQIKPIQDNIQMIHQTEIPSEIVAKEKSQETIMETHNPELIIPHVEKKQKPKKSKLKIKDKKKDKKKQKKKAKKINDKIELSEFSQWLLTGNEEKESRKLKKKKKSSSRNVFDKGQEQKPEVISEPLAQLFAAQGHKLKAIKMYKKLIKLFPENENSYQDEIEKIKNS